MRKGVDDGPQVKYYLFTDKKDFLERLENKVAQKLPDMNIISVVDDHFNNNQTIN